MASCEVDTVHGKGMLHALLHNMTRDSLTKCGITMNGPDKGKSGRSKLFLWDSPFFGNLIVSLP